MGTTVQAEHNSESHKKMLLKKEGDFPRRQFTFNVKCPGISNYVVSTIDLCVSNINFHISP